MVPVNPRESTVLGRTCYPSLAAIPAFFLARRVVRDQVLADFGELWPNYDDLTLFELSVTDDGRP